EVDLRFQVGTGVGGGEGFFELDAAGLEEVAERDVEGLDAAFAAGGDGFLDAHHVALLDELGDVRGVDCYLDGGAAFAVAAHYQALRQDGAEVLGHVEEDLVVLFPREHVDDAVQGFRAVVGVKRGQHQVARSGQVDGRFHTLAVPDLTDEDDVRGGAD